MAVKKVLGYKLRPGSLTDLYRLSDDERLAMLISFLEKMKVEKHKIMNGDWVGTGDTLILFSRKEDGKLHIYVYYPF